MKTVRLGVVLAVAVVAAPALTASGGAAPEPRAVAAALAFLKPQRAKGSVAVYGLPAPVRAGAVVSEAGPTGRLGLASGATLKVHVRSWQLKAKAWLFWEDLEPGAYFVHPSRLVLVDAASSKVIASADLAWWPLVDRKPPPFLRRPVNRRYVVFSKSNGLRSLAAVRPLESRDLPAAARFTGERDCFVAAFDPGDQSGILPIVEKDVAAMNAWAGKNGMEPDNEHATSAASLEAKIKARTDQGCNDVVVYLDGHGLPKPGQKIDGKVAPTSSDVATVVVSSHLEYIGGGLARFKPDQTITSKDIADIANSYVFKGSDGKPHARVHFKLIVHSCFSGRFIDDLAPLQTVDDGHPDPPIRTIATSSSDDRVTRVALPDIAASNWITAFLDGFDKAMANESLAAADKGDLAAMIADGAHAADDTAFKDKDAVIMANNPQTKFAAGPANPLGAPREVPPQPTPEVKPIYAFFNQDTFTTTYSVVATPAPVKYHWTLTPDPTDPKGCQNGGQLTSANATFAYYHGADQCEHTAYEGKPWGHQSTLNVTLTFADGSVCSERIFGTDTGYSEPPRPDSEPVAKPCMAIAGSS